MIYNPLSSPIRTAEMPLGSGVTAPSADGQALVTTVVNGVAGVKLSAGTSGERFVGFVFAQVSAVPFLQTTAVKMEQFTLPAGKTLTLSRTPVASTTQVKVAATGVVAAPDSVTGAVVTLTTAGTAGVVYNVLYRYNLTVAEASSLNGDPVAGGYAGLRTGTVGVIQAGTIFTDQFDSAGDFGAANEVVALAANGQVTTKTVNSSGTSLSATIRQLPTVDIPFLGIDFSAY